jgi:hypothetical protein
MTKEKEMMDPCIPEEELALLDMALGLDEILLTEEMLEPPIGIQEAMGIELLPDEELLLEECLEDPLLKDLALEPELLLAEDELFLDIELDLPPEEALLLKELEEVLVPEEETLEVKVSEEEAEKDIVITIRVPKK